MLRNKQIFQIVRLGLNIFLIIFLIGCHSDVKVSGSQGPVEEEPLPTQASQSEAVTTTIMLSTMTPSLQPSSTPMLPTVTSTSLPATIELATMATLDITPPPGSEIERIFDIGGARIYDFWGERLAISPNEKWLAVINANQEIGSDGTSEATWEEVKLYDYETGQQYHMLQRTPNIAAETYLAMIFSPNSQWLAVAGNEQIIWVWDVISGKLVQQFSFWGPITDLTFSPDGKLLAAVSPSENLEEQGIGVFDMETGSLVAQMRELEAVSVTFLENEEQLVIGAAVYPHPNREMEDTLFIWDYGSNTVSKILSQYGEPRVIAINNEKQILAAVIENKLHLIELQSLVEIDIEKPEVSARTLSFDSAGHIWVLGFDGLLSQWSVDGRLLTQTQFAGATDFVVIPNKNHLLISFPDYLWEVSFDE